MSCAPWYLRAVKPSLLLLLLVLLACAPGACGYRFVGGAAGLPGVTAVAIETPSNDTFEPGLEFVVAGALRRELLRRGAADLVESPDSADLVISGRVAALRAQARSHSSVYFALEYGLTLQVELEVRWRDGRLLEVEKELVDTERYLSSADVESERKNRGEAVRRVAGVLASRYFDRVSEALTR
jgi:hypothetical protein